MKEEAHEKEPVVFSNDQYEVLATQIQAIQTVVDNIESDLSTDRSDIDSLKIRMGTVEDELKTLIERIGRWESKIKDAVDSAVNESVTPMRQTLDRFVESKIKFLNIKPKLKFWQKFFRKNGEVKK